MATGTTNNVLIWLELLRSAKDKLPRVIELYEGRPQTPNCPTVILYGQRGSDDLYCDPYIRPALDAWDVGKITSFDIVRWSRFVMNGEQHARRA